MFVCAKNTNYYFVIFHQKLFIQIDLLKVKRKVDLETCIFSHFERNLAYFQLNEHILVLNCKYFYRIFKIISLKHTCENSICFNKVRHHYLFFYINFLT